MATPDANDRVIAVPAARASAEKPMPLVVAKAPRGVSVGDLVAVVDGVAHRIEAGAPEAGDKPRVVTHLPVNRSIATGEQTGMQVVAPAIEGTRFPLDPAREPDGGGIRFRSKTHDYVSGPDRYDRVEGVEYWYTFNAKSTSNPPLPHPEVAGKTLPADNAASPVILPDTAATGVRWDGTPFFPTDENGVRCGGRLCVMAYRRGMLASAPVYATVTCRQAVMVVFDAATRTLSVDCPVPARIQYYVGNEVHDYAGPFTVPEGRRQYIFQVIPDAGYQSYPSGVIPEINDATASFTYEIYYSIPPENRLDIPSFPLSIHFSVAPPAIRPADFYVSPDGAGDGLSPLAPASFGSVFGTASQAPKSIGGKTVYLSAGDYAPNWTYPGERYPFAQYQFDGDTLVSGRAATVVGGFNSDFSAQDPLRFPAMFTHDRAGVYHYTEARSFNVALRGLHFVEVRRFQGSAIENCFVYADYVDDANKYQPVLTLDHTLITGCEIHNLGRPGFRASGDVVDSKIYSRTAGQNILVGNDLNLPINFSIGGILRRSSVWIEDGYFSAVAASLEPTIYEFAGGMRHSRVFLRASHAGAAYQSVIHVATGDQILSDVEVELDNRNGAAEVYYRRIILPLRAKYRAHAIRQYHPVPVCGRVQPTPIGVQGYFLPDLCFADAHRNPVEVDDDRLSGTYSNPDIFEAQLAGARAYWSGSTTLANRTPGDGAPVPGFGTPGTNSATGVTAPRRGDFWELPDTE